MSFEIASTTTCGQSMLARATATNQLVFVNAKIETTARTANEIGNATALPTLTNPVTGAINSVTYTLNQTRVTVRFNNLVTTADFHTVWLMAKLANEDDSAAVPICAVVSQESIYIPTTSQSDTHIDIHMNLSFVRANGQVSITEGPAWMISDQIQYRNEVRAELDDIETDIDDLQNTVVTISDTQTIYGAKSFNATTAFNGAVQANSTLKVTGTTTVGTLSAGSTTTGTLTTYAITPRTASTSSSTGYDLGASDNRWRYVHARYGEFETSLNTDGSLSVSGISNLSGNVKIGGELYVGDLTKLGEVTANDITSTNHLPTANSTSDSTGSDLGASNARWRYVYGRYGNFSSSITTSGALSVTGASTLTGNTTVGGTLDVTGATTLAGVISGVISSYGHTPRTASTSGSTGYDLGAPDNRWRYVHARYGNFSYSVTVTDGIIVGGSITRPTGSTATQNIGSSSLPFATVYANTFNGNLSGKLTTARSIDGMAFDGSSAITHYGTCSTAANVAAKTVTLTGFSLVTGARILVKFTNSNTASNPTLNVNGTGAKSIYLRVNVSAETSVVTSWEAGDTIEFVYDGSYWRKVNHTTNISGYAAKLATSSTNYLYYYSSTYGLYSTQRICPSTDKGASLGHTDRYWNYGYINTVMCSTISASGNISAGGTLSVTGTSTLGAVSASTITLSSKVKFSDNVYFNQYNNGIDFHADLTPVTTSAYDLGSGSYMWRRLYVNYISGAGVAHSIAGYGNGNSQDASYPIGSLILVQITTATAPSGSQLSNSTLASPVYFGDVPASKLRKITLYASGSNGSVTCHQITTATLSGTWRIIGDVWSSNVTSYPPVVLAVRIA